ncbi:MAG: type I methionyl aminopeptidase [Actinomycetota bacterium]
MVIRKTPQQIAGMAAAGRVLALVIQEIGHSIKPGVSLRDLNEIAHQSMVIRGGVPSFLGYRGFPASICASPNNVIVHGIPDGTVLEEGDIVSADFGLILGGWHADSAFTFPVGNIGSEAQRLLDVTSAALEAGIARCRPGKTLGDVGWAIDQVATDAGFSVVKELVGHGIGRSMHEDPQVANHGDPGRGQVLEEGWVLAIEPMVTIGTDEVALLPDGWGLVTADGSLSAHFEHTVAVTADGPKVLTAL